MPRPDPTRRTPLWLQRLRAKDLLQIVRRQPDFPIVVETYRQCLDDDLERSRLRDFLVAIRDGHDRRRDPPGRGALAVRRRPRLPVHADVPLRMGRPEAGRRAAGRPERAATGRTPPHRTSRVADRPGRDPPGRRPAPRPRPPAPDRRGGRRAPPPLRRPDARRARRLDGRLPRRPRPPGDRDEDRGPRRRRAGPLGPGRGGRPLPIGLRATATRRPCDRSSCDTSAREHSSAPTTWPAATGSTRPSPSTSSRRPRRPGRSSCVPGEGRPAFGEARNVEDVRRLSVALRRREAVAVAPEHLRRLPPEAPAGRTVRRGRNAGRSGRRARRSSEGYAAPVACWEEEILRARLRSYRPAWLDDRLDGGGWAWRCERSGSAELAGFVPRGFAVGRRRRPSRPPRRRRSWPCSATAARWTTRRSPTPSGSARWRWPGRSGSSPGPAARPAPPGSRSGGRSRRRSRRERSDRRERSSAGRAIGSGDGSGRRSDGRRCRPGRPITSRCWSTGATRCSTATG